MVSGNVTPDPIELQTSEYFAVSSLINYSDSVTKNFFNINDLNTYLKYIPRNLNGHTLTLNISNNNDDQIDLNNFYAGEIIISQDTFVTDNFINLKVNSDQTAPAKLVIKDISGTLLTNIQNTQDFNLIDSNLSSYILLNNTNGYISNVCFKNDEYGNDKPYILSAINNSYCFVDAKCSFEKELNAEINKAYAEKNSQISWLPLNIETTESNTKIKVQNNSTWVSDINKTTWLSQNEIVYDSEYNNDEDVLNGFISNGSIINHQHYNYERIGLTSGLCFGYPIAWYGPKNKGYYDNRRNPYQSSFWIRWCFSI